MLFLESENAEKDIAFYINSPGGVISAGMAIYDTMQYVKNDVSTICVGQAASMAAVLMAAGAPGKRYSLPNSRFLIHQPLGYGLQGQATDIEIHAKDLLKMRERINQILAQHTGQSAREDREGHRPRLHPRGRGRQEVRPGGRHLPPPRRPGAEGRRLAVARADSWICAFGAPASGSPGADQRRPTAVGNAGRTPVRRLLGGIPARPLA